MNRKNLIFEFVRLIPEGKVSTYGQIAQTLKIKSPRLVGQILHQNQDPKNISCHRVIFADGSLSKNYAFCGEKSQKEKLKKEGVSLLNNAKVNLKRCLWIKN
jgi:methylated-DNA-protein-cysteine methyltransferase-like protein